MKSYLKAKFINGETIIVDIRDIAQPLPKYTGQFCGLCIFVCNKDSNSKKCLQINKICLENVVFCFL